MCQAKQKGGRRCAIHKAGSMAVITHTAVVHELNEGVVRTVFRALRQEGKAEAAPSKEEVEQFAREQALRAQYDPRIENERKRNTIARRWERAAEDEVDGGTFHAWKNTMAETARRYSRKAVAIGTASVFAFTAAACSGGGGSLGNGTPSASPSPTSSYSQEYTVPDGLQLTGVVENDGEGEYSRVTLAEDASVLTVNPSNIDPAASEKFSQEDIDEANRQIARFAVEEGLDSILVDSSRTDEWWEANKDNYDPEYHADVESSLAMREQGAVIGGLVDNDVADLRENSNYDLKLDGGPRISSLDISSPQVFVAPNGDLAFKYTGTVKRPAVDTEGKEGVELLNFEQNYGVRKGEDGKWRITGWSNSFMYGGQ